MKLICPEHIKTIRFDPEWRAEVIVRQTLVFLNAGKRGCVHDYCGVTSDAEVDKFSWRSQDATEVGRRRRGRDTIVIDWQPRGPIVPFALYEHQYSWFPEGTLKTLTVCTELRCEMKTGLFQCEIIAPHEFEAAVVFERPRWRSLNSERKVIKYALKLLEGPSERPAIVDGGRRIEWKLLGPKVGARFILVVFRRHGVALTQDELQKSSLSGRARQLIGRLASSS